MNNLVIRRELLKAAVNLSLFFGVLLFSVLLLLFSNLRIALLYSIFVFCSILIKGWIAGRFSFKFQQQGKLTIIKLRIPAILISCVVVFVIDKMLQLLIIGDKLPDLTTYMGLGNWLESIIQTLITQTMIIYLFKNRIHEKEKMNIQLEHERIKAVRAKAESLLLKQHIQPHFIFNSLNTLKILYNTDTRKADQYLENLAAFLRSSIAEHEKEVATIQEEMRLVDNYMKMQQIRFGDAIQYHVEISEQLYNRHLPSFTLQPLVENAIKHNAAFPASPLYIHITAHDSRLIVSNNVQPRFGHETTSGMGLNSLAARYRLLAHDGIIIKNENNLFSVSVKILQHEDIDH